MPAANSFGERYGRQALLGCIAVFMLPFIGAGVSLLSIGIRAMQNHESNAFAPLLAGVLFTAFSVSIFVGVFVATKRAASAAALKASAPEQPWLWRPDWSARRIPDSRSAGPAFVWVFAILWNAVTIPVAYVTASDWFEQHNPVVLLALIFPGVGVALIIAAIYITVRRLKFGASICTIDSIPINPGRSFHGEIEMRGDAVPEGGYLLRLVCVHRVVTGSGKNQTTRETPIWQQESRVTGVTAMRLATGGVRVPFSMAIPHDARSSDIGNFRDQVVWRLEASAEMPGVDYAASFDLPVFA